MNDYRFNLYFPIKKKKKSKGSLFFFFPFLFFSFLIRGKGKTLRRKRGRGRKNMSEEIIRVDVSTNFTTPQLNSLSDFFFSFLTRMRNRKRKEKNQTYRGSSSLLIILRKERKWKLSRMLPNTK
jgi:hypothetical protein